jgi:hypothetical protein
MKQLNVKGLGMEKMGNMSILKAFFLKKTISFYANTFSKAFEPVVVIIHEGPLFNLNFTRKFKLIIFFHFCFRHVSGNGGR